MVPELCFTQHVPPENSSLLSASSGAQPHGTLISIEFTHHDVSASVDPMSALWHDLDAKTRTLQTLNLLSLSYQAIGHVVRIVVHGAGGCSEHRHSHHSGAHTRRAFGCVLAGGVTSY